MPMKPHRPLTPIERERAKAILAAVVNDVAKLYALCCEVEVYRTEMPVIRRQRRCLPAGAQRALDALPHHHSTAVEFTHD